MIHTPIKSPRKGKKKLITADSKESEPVHVKQDSKSGLPQTLTVM